MIVHDLRFRARVHPVLAFSKHRLAVSGFNIDGGMAGGAKKLRYSSRTRTALGALLQGERGSGE